MNYKRNTIPLLDEFDLLFYCTSIHRPTYNKIPTVKGNYFDLQSMKQFPFSVDNSIFYRLRYIATSLSVR